MQNIKRLSDPLLDKFCDYVNNSMGLYFPKETRQDLEKKLNGMEKDFGFSDLPACVEWLLEAPLTKEHIAILAKHLTIGETYFFRDAQFMRALEEKLLPKIIRECEKKNKTLRIWSSACCTGEEPYSIAIILSRIIPNLKDWNILILGTDINPFFLSKAEEAVYKDWSLRINTQEFKTKYFNRHANGTYALKPEIKQMVKFMYLNLVEDTYPSLINGTNAMDLIICNNVLIYFSPEQIDKVIQKMARTLVLDGNLCVSAVEVPYIRDPRLAPLRYGDITFFKKVSEEIISSLLTSNLFCPPINFEPLGIQKDLTEDKVVSYAFEEIASEEALTPPTVKKEINLQEEVPKSIDEKAYELLWTLYQAGRYGEVALRLEEKFANAKDDPQMISAHIKELSLLIRAFANQGNLTAAIYWCELGLTVEKLDPILYFLHASILQEMEMQEDAINSLKKSLYLNPDFAMAHFTLGNLLLKQGNVAGSARCFRNVLAILDRYLPDDVLEGSEGMTASRLAEILKRVENKI